jgi:hypothetical protein
MRRGDSKAESGARGGTAWNDGLHSVDGGGSGNGSSTTSEVSGTGTGGAGGDGADFVGKTSWFAPVDQITVANTAVDFSELSGFSPECKDGVCPVPWAVKEETPRIIPDTVDHPLHYTDGGGIECIEAIEAQLSPEAYEGYLQGNCVKYLWRWKNKGGVTDLKKCRWYLDRLVQFKEAQNG